MAGYPLIHPLEIKSTHWVGFFLDKYGMIELEKCANQVIFMKTIVCLLVLCLLFGSLAGCGTALPKNSIVATTLPVYQFTSLLCQGTGISVTQLITESVSCLHDYTLSVSQVKAVEAARLVVTSGAGLEEFMDDLLGSKNTIDASTGIELIESCHGHGEHRGHYHEVDAHIWLSPANTKIMAENICAGLTAEYPEYSDIFAANLEGLLVRLDELESYGKEALKELSTRQLITFHDGFAYFAQAFNLEILKAVEEESGSEASAKELMELITLVNEHHLPAVFTEENGSVSAAGVIARETGAEIHILSMVMSGGDYFDLMYTNIDTLKEALQ